MSKFALAAAALCIAAASAAEEGAPKWWYGPTVEDIKGYSPEDWHQGAGYEACGGDRQSPINFAASMLTYKDMKDSSLSFTSKGCSSDLVSYHVSPHGWQVNLSDCEEENAVHFNGKTYALVQFHFHTPSEHTVGGGHHDADVHMVHVNVEDSGDLLVLGVFIDAASEWSDNTVLDKFWPGLEVASQGVYEEGEDEERRRRLGWKNRQRKRARAAAMQDAADSYVAEDSSKSEEDTEEEEHASSEEEDAAPTTCYPYDIVPGVMDYFTYLGSLTTPPCSEIVTWVHMSEVVPMSTIQFEKFHDAVANHPETQMHLGHVNRDCQDLNGREVNYYK